MALVIRIPSGCHSPQISGNTSSSSKPADRFNMLGSVPVMSQFLGSKLQIRSVSADRVRLLSLRVLASVATAEKPSKVPEILLNPIKEISGTVKLPGSKSLSNRILLIAALSEVTEAITFLTVLLVFGSSYSGYRSGRLGSFPVCSFLVLVIGRNYQSAVHVSSTRFCRRSLFRGIKLS